MNDYEELKKLVRNLLSAIDTEMDLGGYHIDDAFVSDEQLKEYSQAVDEVVFLRGRIEEIIK